MKRVYAKIILASGFILLIFGLMILFINVINEYNFLSKNHSNLYPSNKQFSIDVMETVPRSFSLTDNIIEDNIPILLYHRIIKEEDIKKSHYIKGEINQMIVLKEEFEKQMKYLRDNDFVTLTMQEFYLYFIHDIEIPENSVLITFDDGYKNNFIEAYPVLKKYKFRAVNFIITGSITKKIYPYNSNKVQYLSIKELNNANDVFEYQSHTYSYHKREKEQDNQTLSYVNSRSKEEVKKDIRKSVYNLNGENSAFAYPYGEYSPSTISILKDLGFKMAFTVENKVANRNKDHIYELPRLSILYDTTYKEFIDYVEQ